MAASYSNSLSASSVGSGMEDDDNKRNSNILVAVLSLLEELDEGGLEATQLRVSQLLTRKGKLSK